MEIETIEKKSTAERLAENVFDYAEKSWNLMTLKVADKISGLASFLFTGLAFFGVLMMFIALLCISLAFAISTWVGSYALGFLYTALIVFVVLGIIVYMARNIIKSVVIDKIVNTLYQDEED